MSKPLIQIDDNGTTREMTDQEFAEYEAICAGGFVLPISPQEEPDAD
jgi:hypothetical protein